MTVAINGGVYQPHLLIPLKTQKAVGIVYYLSPLYYVTYCYRLICFFGENITEDSKLYVSRLDSRLVEGTYSGLGYICLRV